MILLADAHRHADQAEASVALVHHAAPVVEVLPVDVPVDDGLRGPAVSGFGEMWEERVNCTGAYRKWGEAWSGEGETGMEGKRTTHCFSLLPRQWHPGVTSGILDMIETVLKIESEKWKLLSRVWLFATPWTIQSMAFSRPQYWSIFPFPSSGDLSKPGIKLRSSTMWVDSLPAEPQGKPKNTGVGSLSLLQQIFLPQESNWGLLHCRKILYQLSYQERFGNPTSQVYI